MSLMNITNFILLLKVIFIVKTEEIEWQGKGDLVGSHLNQTRL